MSAFINPLSDEGSRRRKAEKIRAVLADQTYVHLADSLCVDVGCAYGLITRELAPDFRLMVGVERDEASLHDARKYSGKQLAFCQADGERLPFGNCSVDVIICAQVYEHVEDAGALFTEIWRVLRPGGICFFSGPNRLFPYEFHWRLPFIHWLPWDIANRLASWLSHRYERVRLRSYWALRRMFSGFFIQDYTREMIAHPQRYGMPARRGLAWLCALVFLAPNLNWLLVKPTKVVP